jgi:hypothetical protein
MTVTPLRKPDPTAAIRSRRYRRRKRQTVTAAPRHATATVTAGVMLAAIAVATVSAGFSIDGLTHIFAGATVPVIAMGVALEIGKLSGVAWLGRRYAAPRPIKVAVTALVGTLMAINAIGAYGFLAHAHLTQAVAGQVAVNANAAAVAAHAQVQAAAVADLDKRIEQIDSAIAETSRRGRTRAALALADEQTRRRADLFSERQEAATKLATLQIDTAAVDGRRDELRADAGPVHYLAALAHVGDETAMRYFILLVALLLDPLAVVLLLAAAEATP